MFRLIFLLSLAIFLAGSFGTSQNKSSKQTNGSTLKPKSCVAQGGCCKDGKDGQNGKDGRDGVNGKDGRDGVNGKDGRDGRDGTSRAKGEKGSPGDRGPQGQKGMPGTCDAKGSSSSKSACCTGAECSSGFHLFEKVQDLPTRGAVDVEHFTIDGSLFLAFSNFNGDVKQRKTSSMIYKMDDSTERFTLYQTLQTTGAYDFEYFSITDKHFLAVANHYDGTHHHLDSEIYQWNGKLFVAFQKISTNGASHFSYFNINSEKYLAVANYRSTKSVIYKWSGGKFNKFQEIATAGAMGCAAFVINNETFIAFANYDNSQQQYSVQSTVFKWSAGHFVKLQSLQTYGTYDVKSFNINGHIFLAFANHFSGSKYNIDSFIYKWDGNKFALFQSIPTRAALAWYPFVISGETYLGVANYHDDSQKYNTQSAVYQASGARFIKYQEFPTHGAHDMTSFEYKGQTHVAVVNHYNGQKYNINSALYKWV